ncbi:MAG: Gfo/Idh/MocA family protein [Chloroflexota bacterium]
MRLGMVGCGGMGVRHLQGMAELRRAVGHPFVLAAVADADLARAHAMANEAERLLGFRPVVFQGQAALLAAGLVEAVDINTTTDSHAELCCQALQADAAVFVEKPLAVTIAGCRRVAKVSRQTGRCLAVGENVRRQVGNRLARAIIESGLLGDIRLVIDQLCYGGDAILLTPWRHRKASGGILLDVAVHNADVIRYLVGPVDQVAAQVRLAEPRRYARDGAGPVVSARFYERWTPEMPAHAEADAEDEAVAALRFANGAMGTWTISQAAHGEASQGRWIYGSNGSLRLPPDRSGHSPVLTLDGKPPLQGAELVEAVPAYRLDAATAAVFGGERAAPRELDFAEMDRKLVAVELADFVDAVRSGRRPEVDPAIATGDIALVWSLFEASVAKRWVDVAEVESGELDAYQSTLADPLLGRT